MAKMKMSEITIEIVLKNTHRIKTKNSPKGKIDEAVKRIAPSKSPLWAICIPSEFVRDSRRDLR
jgi:hypothetical protein